MKRYDMGEDAYGNEEMIEADDGGFVRFEDAQAEIAKLTEQEKQTARAWTETQKLVGQLRDELTALTLERDALRRTIVEETLKRADWLRSEYQNGGNYEHLSAREKECRYLAEKIGKGLTP